jgi:isoquinoline 1-oxidoreductase beta subunit
MAFTIKVNGKTHSLDVDSDTPLLWVLRDVLGMTGTKFGCGMALCGACSYLAQVAEVEVSKAGIVRVRRVVCAADIGTVVNPDTVQAQIQGGIIFGATAALYGEITLKNGRVQQSNFDTYQMLRIDDAPAVEVHIVKSSEPPGGMGEPGTSAIVPAIANAVFAATGKRLRKMPVDSNLLKQPV